MTNVVKSKYFGLVYEEDIYEDYKVGEEIKGYIKKIKDDNSSLEKIKKDLKMSKGTFKKAIGGLYKEEIINITDKGIEIRK